MARIRAEVSCFGGMASPTQQEEDELMPEKAVMACLREPVHQTM